MERREYPINDDIVLVITEIHHTPYFPGDRESPPEPAEIEVITRHLEANDGTVLEYREDLVNHIMDKYESLWYDQLMTDVSRDLTEEWLSDEADEADYMYEMKRGER